MSPTEITKAWKDCAFREGLSEAEKVSLPAHPAGASAANSYSTPGQTRMLAATHEILTMGCCDGLTESPGLCSWFCGSNVSDTTYGCCTPGRTV